MRNLSFLAISFMAILILGPGARTANAQVDARGKAQETLVVRIQRFEDQLNARLIAVLDRAENLRARVLERARGISTPKFDLAAVNQSLTEAAAAIAAGREEAAKVQEAVSKARGLVNPSQQSLKELRALVRPAMVSIRAAHQKTVEAIRLIRNAYGVRPVAPPASPPTPPPAQ